MGLQIHRVSSVIQADGGSVIVWGLFAETTSEIEVCLDRFNIHNIVADYLHLCLVAKILGGHGLFL